MQTLEPGQPTLRTVSAVASQRTVVGIGASAGGLRALQLFFDAVDPHSGMTYVVIMHLDPDRESRTPEILQDRTSIPVIQVLKAVQIRPNHIYVIPPGFDLLLEDDTIRIRKRPERTEHLPIDLFFRSLSVALGPDAVGVVLSGTGADGTLGVRDIKERGGITVAQDPEEAEYDSMPKCAIETGQVDLVLPSGSIPGELLRLRQVSSPLEVDSPPPDTEAQLARVFSALRSATGQDFSLYKRSTVLRRLERRLRFNDVATLEGYLPILLRSDEESRALVRDLLISVSGFFRDPAAFDRLASVIPSLFEGKGTEDSVRVWVVGCATGEEAYSIGMLLSEHAATLAAAPEIQIFATDIDEKGYARGREGLYPASAIAHIPIARVAQFFTQESGGYRVKKSLREKVLFAVHNILHDPPFARLDLVSCRNLLIYFQPEAQDQVIATFHYALRGAGVLFLGTSEAAAERSNFRQLSEEYRIYQRSESRHNAQPRLSSADPPSRVIPSPRYSEALPKAFAYGPLHLRMLEAYAAPSLIVNERLDIVHLSKRAGEFLRLGGGEPTHNLVEMAHGKLRMELRTALYQSFEKGVATIAQVAGEDGFDATVTVEVHPPFKDERGSRYALVLFLPHDASAPAEVDAKIARTKVDSVELKVELDRAKEQLETTNAARDRTVHELQMANSEMHSINEEQRAASEELETSREEIQSINEELTTINQEHQNTIEELKRTNADLKNLVECTEIGTIFLDREMRVRRFTPAVEEIFNFVPTDEGRLLAHITHSLNYPGLIDDAERVLASLERVEREVTSRSGDWYIVRINPYLALDGATDGAVLTFFNISAQKMIEEELRTAKVVAESANLAKGTFLATLSHEFRTPLNGILGYADLLQLDTGLTELQARRVERIKAGGWHLAAMIDEILTFTKLDEGMEWFKSEQVDARSVAKEAHALVLPAADAKQLGFALDLPNEIIELETDTGKARQILMNLCGNAVKYTASGSIRLKVRAEGERMVFEVRDTGIGIAPNHRDKIFERFWQVDGGTTRTFGGMGIGLAAAREYSRLLGGDVQVESDVGIGSTFRLWLPRVRAKPVSAQP